MSRLRPLLPQRRQLPLVAWLVVVWAGLWGSVSPLVLVSGVLVALVLVALFPVPDLPPAARPSLPGLAALAGHLVVDLFRSSAQVAWYAVRPGPPPRTAIVAAPLRSRSDAVIAATAELLSLVPGTIVVDVDVPSGTLYLHALIAHDGDEDDGCSPAAREVRAGVRAVEDRVLRALAPRGEPAGTGRGEVAR